MPKETRVTSVTKKREFPSRLNLVIKERCHLLCILNMSGKVKE